MSAELNPKTKLYVSRHTWHDRLDQQGNAQYSTLGATYQITKNLSLEGALSRAGELDKNISWIQLHYTIER